MHEDKKIANMLIGNRYSQDTTLQKTILSFKLLKSPMSHVTKLARNTVLKNTK